MMMFAVTGGGGGGGGGEGGGGGAVRKPPLQRAYPFPNPSIQDLIVVFPLPFWSSCKACSSAAFSLAR
jgi:hypothetical protein